MTDLIAQLRASSDPLCALAADALEIVRDECYRKNCIALFDDNEVLKAKLAEASALLEHARDCHVDTAKRAEKAEAEAAALREALSSIVRLDPSWERRDQLCREALSQPGPGAAYQTRMKKLEAEAESSRKSYAAMRWELLWLRRLR